MTRLVKIVGAGQLGSRHLQALKSIDEPLQIEVTDPSSASLATARERYEGIPGFAGHQLHYGEQVRKSGPTDLAIVPTSAAVRRDAVEQLLAASPVRWMVLEKLLFTEPGDYAAVGRLLRESGTRAWVNCPMRIMPAYQQIKAELGTGPVHYRVSGSKFGLVTNAIHYVDHVEQLTGCKTFTVDTTALAPAAIDSKRAGYLEFEGTLVVRFADGSLCEMTCYPEGTAPVVVEIFTPRRRYIVRESEGKMWCSSEDQGWAWQERPATIPFQSQMTAGVARDLFATGDCGLTPFEDSVTLHEHLLPPLLAHVQRTRPEISSYPFT